MIDKGSFRIRKTLESWHDASINQSENDLRPLSSQYSILSENNNQFIDTYIFFPIIVIEGCSLPAEN